MCYKCVLKLKNMGGKPKVNVGLLNHLTIEFERGHGVPLFNDKRSNLYIEAKMYTNMKRKTRKIYNRKKLDKSDNL